MSYVLVVDDDAAFRAMFEAAVRRAGFAVRTAESGEAALDRMVESGPPDLVLLDQRMGPRGMTGVATLQAIRARFGELPVVMVTAFGDVQTAVAAMKAGALDFLEKPVDLEDLRRILRDALGPDVEDGNGRATGVAPLAFGGIIPNGDRIQAVLALLAAAAGSDAPVLIAGESGTGKEIAAAFVHEHSPRRQKPFVKVNCAAIPGGLLEAEMFGCEAGAYTGAVRAREGRFAMAHTGTLLLDEIAEMSPELQAKLLRVLQDKEVEPLGGTRRRKVDVRVVASTNRSIADAIAEGAFREDLYFRLNVFEVVLPPLRERPLDILPLARRFLAELGGERPRRLSPEAEGLLLGYAWPGNIRELRNNMERASILARGGVVHPEHLPPALREGEARPSAVGVALPRAGTSVHEMERALIVETLVMTEGNRTKAAESMGMSRRALLYKLKRYGIV